MSKYRDATSPRPRGEQSVGTPWEFIDNFIIPRYGPLDIDLAATPENAKSQKYITKEQNFFEYEIPDPASPSKYHWLNPPFSEISQFIGSVVTRSINCLVLVPAAVGSNWYRDLVQDLASEILFLNPRMKFEGHSDPYPKDLMLVRYNWSYGDPKGQIVRPVQIRWKR